jgi:hypothetical protein
MKARVSSHFNFGDVSCRRELGRHRVGGIDIDGVGRPQRKWVGEVAVEDRCVVPQATEDVELNAVGPIPVY